MLIYNHNKEFIGIDIEDLRKLHYRSFSDLLDNCSDFADLFVKKPGYIHNFKNFKWIDFVIHSDSDESEVLISANKKTFSASLKVKIIYLADSPSEPSYLIELMHLKNLKDDEDSIGLTETFQSTETFEATHNIPAQLPSFDEIEATTLVEPDPLDVPEQQPDLALYNPESPFLADSVQVTENIIEPDIPTHAPPPEMPDATASNVQEEPMLGDYLVSNEDKLLIDELKVDPEYQYTPQVAADELGLPVDLIEEFIGDFITQSYEFKDELFDSISEHNFDNIKNLSHKLKGVAANLRIEDSFEVLNLLNITHDIHEAKIYLNHFYSMISKLEGKDVNRTVEPDQEAEKTSIDSQTANATTFIDDDIYRFETSVEPIDVPDASTPPPLNNDLYDLDIVDKENFEEPKSTLLEEDLYSFDDLTKEDHPAPQEIETPFVSDDTLKADETPEVPVVEEVEKIEKAEMTVDEAPLETITYQDIHYNQSKAAYELGIDSGFINELKDDFITQTLSHKDEFQIALESANDAAYKQIALELKGVSDNLRISDVSLTLEELIKSNSANDAKYFVNQLYHYIKQL